mgnify:CR=1 FL=1
MFEYVEPKSLKEASRFLAKDPGGTVPLAGGTDLFVNMKHRVIKPRRVVNLKTIPKLKYISEATNGLRIGALSTLHEMASSSTIRRKYPVLIQAAREVGAYAHQVMGTIGGNLCQSNRCRFYNQSAFWRSSRPICYKAGGNICHVVRKPRVCHSTYCGDMAPVLIALDAQVKLAGPAGERSLPLKKLYTQEGKKSLSLRKGEILKEILIPPPSGKTLYLKWRLRDSLEFPIVSLALRVEKGKDGRVQGDRIIFSAVGSGPVETTEGEKMVKGTILDDESIEKVSAQVTQEVSPMRTSLASPAYKRKMAGILLKQALEELRNAE